MLNMLQNLLPKTGQQQTQEKPNKAKILLVTAARAGMDAGRDQIPSAIRPLMLGYLDQLNNQSATDICNFIIDFGKNLERQLNDQREITTTETIKPVTGLVE